MFDKFIRAIWVMIAAVSLSALSGPAYARHELTVEGGRGDAAAKVECPPGQVLVGFSGRYGAWLVRIQAVCAIPQADGNFSQPIATGPEYGGTGSTRADGFCPRGTMMSHAYLHMTYEDRQVAWIEMTCRSRVSGEETQRIFGNTTYNHPCTSTFGVGNCPAQETPDESCPPDEMPVGYGVRYGNDVNAFGMICGRVANAAPVVVAAVVPPPPPPPTKTIKQTGRPRDGSAAASVEANPWISQLAGVWHMTTNSNIHYDLTLTVSSDTGTGALVRGDFVNTDGTPAYDGNLRGYIPHDLRRVTYAYTQPASNTGGNGMMTISSDGTKLSGDGVDGPSKAHWSWSGTREGAGVPAE